MEKTATLNLRVNPDLKHRAEDVLKQLGIPMSVAIDMFLSQIALTQGIPFALKMPKEVNADLMTGEELRKKIRHGYEQAVNGNTMVAEKAFESFRKSAQCEI